MTDCRPTFWNQKWLGDLLFNSVWNPQMCFQVWYIWACETVTIFRKETKWLILIKGTKKVNWDSLCYMHMPYNFIIRFLGWFIFHIFIFLTMALLVGCLCTLPMENLMVPNLTTRYLYCWRFLFQLFLGLDHSCSFCTFSGYQGYLLSSMISCVKNYVCKCCHPELHVLAKQCKYASLNWVILVSGNGLPPVQCQAFIWTNDGLSLIS